MKRLAPIRLALSTLLLAMAAGLPSSSLALAEDAAPAAANPQLDRIEHKLDEILRRLDASPSGAPLAQPPALSQSPGSPAPAKAQPVATNDVAAYKPGAVAIAHAAPEKTRDLEAIPADSVGGFVYTGGPITLSDLKSTGVRYTGLAAFELQAWLKVTTAGRTQLAVEFKATTGAATFAPPSCITTMWLEDKPIGTQSAEIPVPAREEKTIDLVLGADLQPGLYRLRTWAACTPARDLKLVAEVLAKGPNDLNLRAVTGNELLHQTQ